MKITRVWRRNLRMRSSKFGSRRLRGIVHLFFAGKRKALEWSNGLFIVVCDLHHSSTTGTVLFLDPDDLRLSICVDAGGCITHGLVTPL